MKPPALVSLAEILAAQARLAGVVDRTPLLHSRYLSELTGADVWLKAECLQRTGSFKVRGATNMIALLTPEERRAGVIAVSAGNHAQGVAVAAAAAGIACTVVMPESAALAKVEATKAYGATVIQSGANFAEASAVMRSLADRDDLTIVPPFDDVRVIAGQGTVGLEIAEDAPNARCVLVPVGGGGLATGVAVAIKARMPEARVIGVQAAAVPGALESFRQRRAITARIHETIADGIAIAAPSATTLPHLLHFVDDIVSVDEESITRSIVVLLERCKLVVEGAGAVGVAALLSGAVQAPGGTIIVILSGGNVDLNLVGRIVEHGLAQDGRYLALRVLIADQPGQLARVLGIIGGTGANVLNVEHRRTDAQLSFGSVAVELLLETRNRTHAQQVADALVLAGFHLDRGFQQRSHLETYAADGIED